RPRAEVRLVTRKVIRSAAQKQTSHRPINRVPVASSTTGRDRTPRIEPAKMPANFALFVRDRKHRFASNCVVWMQPASNQPKFPENREINREFAKIWPSAAIFRV